MEWKWMVDGQVAKRDFYEQLGMSFHNFFFITKDSEELFGFENLLFRLGMSWQTCTI